MAVFPTPIVIEPVPTMSGGSPPAAGASTGSGRGSNAVALTAAIVAAARGLPPPTFARDTHETRAT